MADLQVQITMSVETVEALQKNGSLLYTLKAVQSSSKAGRPLVWRRTDGYSALTSILWPQAAQAYTAFNPIAPDQKIEPGFSAAIQIGQTLQVKANGIGTVVNGGPPAYISFYNTAQSYFTCGLACQDAPFCALPLYGLHEQSCGPLEKVLLMFSTDDIAPATVVESSLHAPPPLVSLSMLATISPGILIDMRSTGKVQVAFDINKGWSWSPGVQASPVPATANLTELLIEPQA